MMMVVKDLVEPNEKSSHGCQVTNVAVNIRAKGVNLFNMVPPLLMWTVMELMYWVAVANRGHSPAIPTVIHRIQNLRDSPPPPPPTQGQEFVPYIRTWEVFNLDPLESADTAPRHIHNGQTHTRWRLHDEMILIVGCNEESSHFQHSADCCV